jgi:hypothetical protein
MKAIVALGFAAFAAGCGASPDSRAPEGNSVAGGETPSQTGESLSAEEIAAKSGDPNRGMNVTTVRRAADGSLVRKTEHWTAEQYLAQIRAKMALTTTRPATPPASGDIGSTQQAITVDYDCAAVDLWVYDATYGAMFCLVDTGQYVFTQNAFDVWYHNLGAYWPGKDWGELYEGTNRCGDDISFSAWGAYTTVSPSDLPTFDDVQLNQNACWVP